MLTLQIKRGINTIDISKNNERLVIDVAKRNSWDNCYLSFSGTRAFDIDRNSAVFQQKISTEYMLCSELKHLIKTVYDFGVINGGHSIDEPLDSILERLIATGLVVEPSKGGGNG